MTRDDIDKKIGMPDVDAEWKKFEQENRSLFAGSRREFSFRKIAAILVAALMLTGLSYAAVRTSFFTQSWEAPTSSTQSDSIQTDPITSSRGQESSPSRDTERGFIVFNNVRLDSVMMQIDRHYQVTTRFTDESIRGIRMLLKWNPKQPLDEVLDLLNGFERLKVYREKDELIIEKP